VSKARALRDAPWSVARFFEEWVAAGLRPRDFWKETPRSFVIVMQGAAERDRRAMTAVSRLPGGSRTSPAPAAKLKPLKHYLELLKPKKVQAAEDILAVFREHQRRGAAIRIRHIKPGEE
jgi:hypothetical protein